MRVPLLAALSCLLGADLALAQSELPQSGRAPVLMMVTEAGKPPEKVGPRTVDLRVAIVGRLAHTQMTLTFGNPAGRVMAGDLFLPLPERATVSGYALDVAGKMVDGVVVGHHEARRIFEREARKGVDPGLVEWSKGNVFKTRVFPIPAGGSRTIRVEWVSPLDAEGDAAAYALPLAFHDPVDLALRVEVRGGAERPVVTGEGPLTLQFREARVAEAKVTHSPVVQNLRIAIPDVARHPVQVEVDDDGAHWFAIQDVVPVPALGAMAPKRIRVVWDASLSRDHADHKAELDLLKRLLTERFVGAEVEVVVVRHLAEPPKRFGAGNADAVLSFLTTLMYDGASQLGEIAPITSSSDLILVFSDGLSTFGNDEPGPMGAPTWIVSSSVEAAHDALAHIAKRNGGAYYNLTRSGAAVAALAGIGRPVFSVLSARATSGSLTAVVPVGSEPVVGPTFVGGRLETDSATVEVAWGVPGQAPSITRSYVVSRADAQPGQIVARARAERELSALMASPQQNAAKIKALGQTYGIVTPGTSLLVLESLDQYLEYAVRPPRSWPELRVAYDAALNERKGALEIATRDRLTEVLSAWREEVSWYERAFKYPAQFRFGEGGLEQNGQMGLGVGMGAGGGGSPEAAAAPEPRADRMEMVEDVLEESDSAKNDSVAEKKKESGANGAVEPSEPAVALRAWTPDTPYLRALAAATDKDLPQVYLAQRAEFGAAPSFFLDVADFLLAKKERALAIRVLSNVAELRLADPALLRVLAHRLEQLDELNPAVRTFETVLELRPEEPQSYRDLALVLGRRALARQDAAGRRQDWERAMSLLAEVVKRRWDRFEAIELIALTELNRFWLHAKTSGVETFPLPKDFIRAMELDVRIVMNWDADMTDMDLHVVEPSNEEAYYGHNLTTIGGKVSRDFTQGYGPEVYSVRRAMRGPFKVKTKFFGSSAAQLQGAVTLQVDVFTNWGRKNEKRQSMTLRLTENKEEFVVGEITF